MTARRAGVRRESSPVALPAVVLRAVRLPAVALLLAAAAPAPDPALAQPVHADSLPALELERDLSISGGEDPRLVGPVTRVAPDGRGRIAVFGPRLGGVLLYGPDGGFLRRAGRPGEGRGGLRRPVFGGWRGDSVWIHDPRAGRLALHPPGGADPVVFRPPRYPVTMRRAAVGGLATPLADGTVLLVPRLVPRLMGDSVNALPVVRARRGGGIVDTLGTLRLRAGELRVRIGPDRYRTSPQPFRPGDRAVAASGGEAVLFAAERVDPEDPSRARLRVVKRTPAGDTIWSRAVAVDRRRTTGATADSLADLLARRWEAAAGARPELEARIRRALFVPDFYPALTGVIPGADGSVWLRGRGVARTPGRTRWLVLSAGGEPAGRVTLAPGERLAGAAREHVWTVGRDEAGAPVLTLWRIER